MFAQKLLGSWLSLIRITRLKMNENTKTEELA